jgi:hypothetical protein
MSALIEKYGSLDGYPHWDGTIRPNDDATFDVVAYFFNASLERITEVGNDLTAACL